MRIALFSWESLHSVAVGGLGVHTTELSAALERKGHEVHVFCRGGTKFGYQKFDGVHYHFVEAPLNEEGDLVESMKAMCNNMVWTFGETQDHVGRFDIASAHDWMTVKALVQVKNFHNIPCTFTFHSTESGRNLSSKNGDQRIKDLELEAASIADKVISVSARFQDEVMTEYRVPESKSWVVPNGINCNNFDGKIDCAEVKGRYDIGCMDPVMLFVGRMASRLKGSDLIVEAMPGILEAHSEAKAVFVGDGDFKMKCDKRSQELGVDGSCRFLGAKRGQELIDLYKACDVVVVPSRNEPFGLIVLEAWAAGKPVVVSDQVGCPVNEWEDGLIVSCTPDDIARGCSEIFRDFDRAREMGSKGRRKARCYFSWDLAASIQEACFEDVLQCDRCRGA
jgi:glycosyltransferase involved in cell wall biosynthesis